MMQKNHKIPILISCLGIGSLLFSYLTFTPNPAFAETEERTLMNIKYMQQLSPEICANTALNKTKRLIDNRDDDSGEVKSYWVTKLKDGNCWMTQNLDLDITENTKLTSDDSDIPVKESPWEPKDSAKYFTGSVATWGNTDTDIKTYNPGQYVYTKPADSDVCNSKTELSQCGESKGWQNVSDTERTKWTPMTEPRTDKKVIEDIDTNNKKYDAHYLIGNYYSWNAATAGSGNSMTSGTPTRSICPKRWKLPTANNGNSDGSFQGLLKGADDNYGWSNNNDVPAQINSPNGLYGDPLYFFYGGTISSALANVGHAGYYWSSAPNSDGSNAYYFTFAPTNVYSFTSTNRYMGMPVRCVVVTTTKDLIGNSNTNEQLWPDPNYPDDPDFPLEIPSDIDPADANASIAIRVSPVLNLEVIESAEGMEVDFNSIDKKTININVAANEKYRITLSTEQPNLLPQDQEKNTKYIQMVGTEGGIVAKGKTGWGIKKKKSATDDNELGSLDDEEDYSPVGIDKEQITFYRSNSPEYLNEDSEKGQLKLEVGVSVSQAIPLDTYYTTVIVTASAY